MIEVSIVDALSNAFDTLAQVAALQLLKQQITHLQIWRIGKARGAQKKKATNKPN